MWQGEKGLPGSAGIPGESGQHGEIGECTYQQFTSIFKNTYGQLHAEKEALSSDLLQQQLNSVGRFFCNFCTAWI